MKILAIESSCDETSASVVENGRKILSCVTATQIEEHRLYGGVVPEIASRRHTESISGVVAEAIEKAGITYSELDAVAVTHAPGLIGALITGVNFAKGLAMSLDIPLVGVHHLRSHIASNYLAHKNLEPPFMSLIVSGGHTHIVEVKSYTEYKIIGKTRDDAAGEAFDKVARVLGYPYPGGVFLDTAAVTGNGAGIKLPRPKVEGSELDMSFSGLKTAVINLVHNAEQKGEEFNKEDIAAAFTDTVVEIISKRVLKACEMTGSKKLVVAGGVSANSHLRKALLEETTKHGIELFVPPLELCGDNAAMVGSQGYYELQAGNRADMLLNATATVSIATL